MIVYRLCLKWERQTEVKHVASRSTAGKENFDIVRPVYAQFSITLPQGRREEMHTNILDTLCHTCVVRLPPSPFQCISTRERIYISVNDVERERKRKRENERKKMREEASNRRRSRIVEYNAKLLWSPPPLSPNLPLPISRITTPFFQLYSLSFVVSFFFFYWNPLSKWTKWRDMTNTRFEWFVKFNCKVLLVNAKSLFSFSSSYFSPSAEFFWYCSYLSFPEILFYS